MTTTATARASAIETILGNEAAALLGHQCKGIPKERLILPGPDSLRGFDLPLAA